MMRADLAPSCRAAAAKPARIACHGSSPDPVAPLPRSVPAHVGPAGYFPTQGRSCEISLKRHTGGAWRPVSVPPTSLLDLQRVALPSSSRGSCAAFSGGHLA